ncbi:ABC transporter ATP-binding protein, partial [Magnetococcales bacterium HHB-1]
MAQTPSTPHGQIGTLLIQAGKLSQDQIEHALAQRKEKTPDEYDVELIGEYLVTQGLLTQHELLAFLHQQFKEEQARYRHNPQFKPIIRFENIEKTLDNRKVLNGVNLEIPKGKITAVIGVSGGGKSVTLKHMVGLMKPEKGTVWIDNDPINQLSAKKLNQVRKRFSMLFQSSALFDSMNVFDNVAFPLREKTELTEEEIHKRVTKSL